MFACPAHTPVRRQRMVCGATDSRLLKIKQRFHYQTMFYLFLLQSYLPKRIPDFVSLWKKCEFLLWDTGSRSLLTLMTGSWCPSAGSTDEVSVDSHRNQSCCYIRSICFPSYGCMLINHRHGECSLKRECPVSCTFPSKYIRGFPGANYRHASHRKTWQIPRTVSVDIVGEPLVPALQPDYFLVCFHDICCGSLPKKEEIHCLDNSSAQAQSYAEPFQYRSRHRIWMKRAKLL